MAGSSSGPRGGRRQVDKAHRATGPDAADAAPEVADSKLYRHLVREWAWGGLSACEAQRLASLAHADEQSLLLRLGMSRDYGCPQVKSLAAIGAWGRYPGNCARDLIRLLGEPRSPPLVSFPIPLKILTPARHMPAVQNIEQAMFLPHVQFAHMWNDRKDMFDEVMLGGGDHPASTPARFWTELEARKDPRLLGHDEMTSRASWRDFGIPLSVHGDAVPCIAVGRAGTRSLDVYSWQSCFANGPSIEVKQLAVSIFEQNKASGTMEAMWEVMLWSFVALSRGEWPRADHKGVPYAPGSAAAALGGRPLAGGYYAVILQVKGDWDWFAKVLGLRSATAHKCCEWCDSDKSSGDSGMWPTDFSDAAVWKRRLYTVEGWRAQHERLHPLFVKFEWLTLHNLELDELHVLYLGTSMDLLGAALFTLCFKVLAKTPAENMADVWADVVYFYQQHELRNQYTNIELSSFLKDARYPRAHYPRLKGKGAEVKDLAIAARSVWQKRARPGNAEDALILEVLSTQCDIQQLVDSSSSELFMPPEDARLLQAKVDRYLVGYSRLARAADLRGELVWAVKPKHHALWHWSRRARFLHPRRGSCWGDEDYVGRIKTLTQQSTAGAAWHRIPATLAVKYRWGMWYQRRR